MPLYAPPTVGTWTPVLTFATPGDLARTYGAQFGGYVRDGRLVKIWFRLETSAFTFTTASGALQITGLPFVAGAEAGSFQRVGSVVFGGITKASYSQICPAIAPGDSLITFLASGSAQAAASITASDTPTAGSIVLRGQIDYLAA